MELVQGSKEWLEYRRKRIGSSEAAVIMNESPYATARELMQEKLGLRENTVGGFAVQRGVEVEPIARATYCFERGLEFTPIVVESEDSPWMSASLDGFDYNENFILEIKVPGREVMEEAMAGRVHPKYIWQLEHQLIVTKAREVHFVCVEAKKDQLGRWRITDEAVVIYKGDPEKQKILIEKEREFFEMMQRQELPALCERDVLERTEPEVVELYQMLATEMKRMKVTKEALKKYEAAADELKAQIISRMVHIKEQAAGVKVSMVMTKSLNAELLAEKGLDPEQFKAEKVSYRATLLE